VSQSELQKLECRDNM